MSAPLFSEVLSKKQAAQRALRLPAFPSLAPQPQTVLQLPTHLKRALDACLHAANCAEFAQVEGLDIQMAFVMSLIDSLSFDNQQKEQNVAQLEKNHRELLQQHQQVKEELQRLVWAGETSGSKQIKPFITHSVSPKNSPTPRQLSATQMHKRRNLQLSDLPDNDAESDAPMWIVSASDKKKAKRNRQRARKQLEKQQ